MARAVERDQHHAAATRTYRAFGPDVRLFVSDYCLDEAVTRILGVLGHKAAVAAGAAILGSSRARFERVSDEDFALAWKLFQRYDDKGLSFTDCTILAQVERLELDAVFTFDAGFRKVGVKVVPGKA